MSPSISNNTDRTNDIESAHLSNEERRKVVSSSRSFFNETKRKVFIQINTSKYMTTDQMSYGKELLG